MGQLVLLGLFDHRCRRNHSMTGGNRPAARALMLLNVLELVSIVEPIGDEDIRFVLEPIQKIKDREISPPAILDVDAPDSDLCYTCHDPAYTGSWDSMKRALTWAFCTAGARRWFRRERFVPRIEADTNLDVAEKDQKFTKALFDALFNGAGDEDDYGAIADYPAWADIQSDRADYELLPRLWMTPPTVMELKKTAIVERRMHESIRENFAVGFSPCDPAHYQQIYFWARFKCDTPVSAVPLIPRI